MNKRLISVFVFALTVSAGAAFVLYQLISSKVTAGAASHPTTKTVFVASRDLQPGALITDRDISKQEYIAVPDGAIAKREDILNRGVISAIHRDTPFFDGTLAKQGEGAGFATIIPPGMRAFTVRVNEVVGVAGFAVAGLHVDVRVAGTPPGGSQGAGSISRTLLQNISVLSAGQNYQKDAEGKPVLVQVVNLLVTPAQAEILNLATDERIQLVLRNPTDDVITQTTGAATANLFEGSTIHSSRVNFLSSDSAPAPPQNGSFAPRPRRKPEVAAAPALAAPAAAVPPPAPKTSVVEVFSGASRSQIIINQNPKSATETAR
jgi:pilus assembly protein CpaB